MNVGFDPSKVEIVKLKLNKDRKDILARKDTQREALADKVINGLWLSARRCLALVVQCSSVQRAAVWAVGVCFACPFMPSRAGSRCDVTSGMHMLHPALRWWLPSKNVLSWGDTLLFATAYGGFGS